MIFGETGSGKTTIANLILGLYLPHSGDVFIDDVSVSEVDRRTVRRHIAVVFQESGLMNGSIIENILSGQENADRAKAVEAAKLACVHDFIMTLPRNYDHVVGANGCLLSAGQKQRIAIARALVRDAPILILDEATSNLDVHTERAILEGVRHQRKNRTTIVISHRIQAALVADEVAILEKGTICERGSHIDLLAKGGRYRALWGAVSSENVIHNPFCVDNVVAST